MMNSIPQNSLRAVNIVTLSENEIGAVVGGDFGARRFARRYGIYGQIFTAASYLGSGAFSLGRWMASH